MIKKISAVLLCCGVMGVSVARQVLDDVGRVWQVEMADTEAARARGLMFRSYIAPMSGMLFVFERAEPAVFWMFQTYTPLAMYFFDENGRMLTAYPYAAPCFRKANACPHYPAYGGAVKYVLETRAVRGRVPYALPQPVMRLQYIH